MDASVGFIGAGNMAEALARPLSRSGRILYASDPSPERRAVFAPLARGGVFTENDEIVRESEILVLAVKPQIMRTVLSALGPAVPPEKLVVSIAAGIGTDFLRHFIPRAPIVRVMPNTACLVGKGMSVLFAPPEVGPKERNAAEALFQGCGMTAWVGEEPLLDAVTALSGSGPAYFFQFCEHLVEAACGLGLSPPLAEALSRQTFIGSAELLAVTEETPETLRKKVTSPGGTTEAALRVFQERGLGAVVAAALETACRRAGELRAHAWEDKR
jgi:pyrroline-5-carboxylate reductase